MGLEMNTNKLNFQIIAKLDADKKNKGVRLKKIEMTQDGDSIKATFMANNTEEYLKIRQEFGNFDKKISLKAVGKSLNLVVQGEDCSMAMVEAFSFIGNFEAETEKFVKFLCKLREIIVSEDVEKLLEIKELQLKIESVSFLEKLAGIEIEATALSTLHKDEFCDKFLNLNLDYEFGIIK